MKSKTKLPFQFFSTHSIFNLKFSYVCQIMHQIDFEVCASSTCDGAALATLGSIL